MTFFLQCAGSGLMVGAIYGLVAVGFVLIIKSSGIFNLAQGELLCIGAFICWSLLSQLQLPAWAAVILTLVLAGLLGAALERFPLRLLIGQPLLAIVMVTLTIGICLRGLMTAIWGGLSWKVFTPDLIPRAPLHIGELSFSQQHIWGFVIAMVAVAALSLYYQRTRSGLGMRVVAEGHQVAQSMGLSVKATLRNVWALSAIIAAIGGILLGSINGINIPLSNIGLKAIPAALIGGLESIPGAICGGLIIGLMEGIAGGYIGHGTQDVAAYIIMLVILFVLPYGFFGYERIERV